MSRIMGAAIFFVLTLAATMIVGTFVFAYAAHSFVTVVEQTAAGNDEVVWPGGPFIDWLWEVVYVLWLSALWLGPVVLLLSSGAAGDGRVLFAAAGLVWLLFPITLLSSMSATSRWVILSPRLLSRLLGQRLGSLVLFYLHSGPVLAASAAFFYLAFYARGGVAWVLLTAGGLAAALIVYARQLGRLAHLIEHTRGRAARIERRLTHRRVRIRVAAHDPWADESNRPRQPSELPPVMSPSEGPITGYDVRYDDRPIPESPPPPRKRPPDLDDVPYELVGAPNQPPPRGPMPKQWTEPSDYEMSLARGGVAPPPPKYPWAVGVYNFPFYPRTLPPLVALAGGFALLGVLIGTLVAFKPA